MIEAYARHRDEIAGILDERFFPIGYVDQQIAGGQWGVLANDTSVLVLEMKIYPGGAKELHAVVAAGETAGIVDLARQAVEFGTATGCDVATVESREGWKRVLAPMGFKAHQLRLIKELR